MTDTETLVKLKYQLITSNEESWHLCKTYPAEVRSKWAWRCAEDVEHLADGHEAAMECIRVAKAFRDGLASEEELARCRNVCWDTHTPNCHIAYATAQAAYAAARCGTQAAYVPSATHAAAFATSATHGTTHGTTHAHAQAAYAEKFNEYTQWLKEELIKYEDK